MRVITIAATAPTYYKDKNKTEVVQVKRKNVEIRKKQKQAAKEKPVTNVYHMDNIQNFNKQ